MSINLTDEIEVKTKKGKLGAAKQIFLEGDTQTVEKEIQNINSRHNDLSSKHESLNSMVSEHTKQIESNQSQITANKSAQDAKNASLDNNIKKLNTRDDQITELVKGVTATGGASVATAVTYDNTSSHLASATVQGAVDELQGSKIDKTSILQESGDDENSVMSQKATTTAIADETKRAMAAEKAIMFDISSHNNGAVFESLSALLSSSNLSTLIPTSVRRGGMTIRFIQGSEQSSDNTYVQFRYTGTAVTGTPNPFLETDNWQNMGVADAVLYTIQEKTELEKECARQNIGASWDGIHTISDYSLDLLLEILSNAVYTTPQYDNVQEVINNIRSTGQSITVVVKEPSISYGENGKVLMRTITSGASIKYTLDGTTPTKNVGNLYGVPFYPNMDCTIKAVAYKDNVVSTVSEFVYNNSVTYIQFTDPVVEAFLVPKVDTNGDGIIDFTEAAALSIFMSTWFKQNTDIVYFNEFKFFTGVSEIKSSSFKGCTQLKSIEIPNSVTYIGSSVFKDCSSLEHVIIGDHVETIDTYVFQNCVSLEEVNIPASVKEIKGSAFINSGLKTIVIPNTVTTLGANLISNNKNIKSIIIGNGVSATIGSTFRNCPALELVDLGNGITSVGNMDFAGSNNLKTIICRATTPPTLGIGSLPNVNIDIYVPDSSVAAYTSSSWKTNKTTIHSINEL